MNSLPPPLMVFVANPGHGVMNDAIAGAAAYGLGWRHDGGA